MVYTISSLCLLMLGIKARLIYRVSSSTTKSLFLPFFIPLAALNTVEMTLYFDMTQSMLSLRLYYVFALSSVAAALYVSSKLSGRGVVFSIIHLLASLCLVILFMFSELLIIDYIPFLATITAIKGGYYYLFQAVALLGLVAIIVNLSLGIIRSKSRQTRARCSAFLASISVLVLFAIMVIVAMAVGLKMNATIWMPVATTIFMLMSRVLIGDKHCFDITQLFKRETLEILKMLTISGDRRNHDLRADKKAFEEIIVRNAIDDCEGNLDSAAQRLGISRTSVTRKMK